MPKKVEIKIACDGCGSSPPIDEAESNENWTKYAVKEPCECGGKFVINFGNEDA